MMVKKVILDLVVFMSIGFALFHICSWTRSVDKRLKRLERRSNETESTENQDAEVKSL